MTTKVATLTPLTDTTIVLPLQRTADEVGPIEWADLPSCSYTGDPVPDMDDHVLHCGDCFAHHVMEN